MDKDDKIMVHHLMQEESDFSSNEEEKIDAYTLSSAFILKVWEIMIFGFHIFGMAGCHKHTINGTT
jgi:hypothetical protein